MRKLISVLHRALEVLLVLATGVLIIPISLQIFSRYTPIIPSYIWTEELARFCFIWMIMIGAMIGVRESSHFDVDLWPKLGARADAALRLFGQAMMLIFALIFVQWGIKFFEFGRYQTSEIAELPMWMIFLAWPLTGLAWLVFLGEHAVAMVRQLVRGEVAQ